MKFLLAIAVALLTSCSKPVNLEIVPMATADQNTQRVLLTPSNTVTIRGEIDGGSMTEAMLQLATLVIKRGKSTYPIYVVLDSPGGSMEAGEMFIDFAKSYPNIKTIAIDASSMASAIIESLPGERLVVPNASMMFHRARTGVQGQVEEGELESRLKHIKLAVLRLEKRNAERIGISLQDYKAKVKDEWWITGENAVSQGVADRVVEIACSTALIEQRRSVTVGDLFGSFNMELSGCPLFRFPLPQGE